MANPQIEDGHIDIANEIGEALAHIRLSGEETQCLWVILRHTYGWHKKEDWISLSQFVLSTGIKKSNICRALYKMIQKNIIIKKDNGNKITYQFQKDFDSWKPLSKKITLSKKIIRGTQKRDIQKKVLQKKTYTLDFLSFWDLYPKKIGKGKAWQQWKRIKPDQVLISTMESTIRKFIKTDQWKKSNGQYIPNPATWLHQERWDDQILEKKDSW